MRLLRLLPILPVLILSSCNSPKVIAGTYTSNFAVRGFFMTQIKLHSDSTLEYRYWGDMAFDTATANYRLVKNRLYLKYYPIKVDTSNWTRLRQQGITIMENELNRYGKSAPFQLLVRDNKLFLVDSNGTVIKRKADRKEKRKKYFLIKTST
jgi:hypothetical protein